MLYNNHFINYSLIKLFDKHGERSIEVVIERLKDWQGKCETIIKLEVCGICQPNKLFDS